MQIITYDKYLSIVKEKNNPYWNNSYKQRWNYYKVVAEMVKKINPKTVIEAGSFGIPIVLDCDTIDKDLRQNPTYCFNLINIPYPLKNNIYDLFIALQIFEHLENNQKQVFEEIKKISKNAIISFPYKWKKGHISHMDIDENKISKWTNNYPFNKKIIIYSRIIYSWSFYE